MLEKLKTIALLATSAVMIFSNSVFSQEQEIPLNTKSRGGRGYFMAGTNILDFDGFNAALRAQGYPTFSSNLFSIGLGGHGIINRFILGGEAHGLLTSNKNFSLSGRRYKRSLETGYAFFNVGYQIIRHNGFALFPLIGLGGGGMTLRILDKTTSTFDEILADPGRSATLTTGGILTHASLGLDYLVTTRQTAHLKRGFVLGLRAGYNFAPITGDWHLEASDVDGGPELRVTGPYARLIIGLGNDRLK